MSAGEWHKGIVLEEVEDAGAEQICNDTDVIAEIKAIPKVDTLVPVEFVV